MNGLHQYAIGAVLLGIAVFCIIDDGGFKGDFQSYGIALAAAFVFFGLGYISRGRNKK